MFQDLEAFMSFREGEYNPKLIEDIVKKMDPWCFLERVRKMHVNMKNDKDRIRLQGEYYNNVHINGRMFGPSRKQMFIESMMGGMERRFEIIDSQVNHVSFEHTVFDKNLKRCRNPRIKCSDKTRVVLNFQATNGDQNDFIHANRVRTPFLFNEFIVTQHPMENTVEDFWRMAWQEKSRFILMLNNMPNDESPIFGRRFHYLPMRGDQHKIVYDNLTVEASTPISGEPNIVTTTLIVLTGPRGEKHRITHFQVNMNDTDDLETPLLLLRYARCCSKPTIVHDTLGISRAGVLIAIEMCIFNLLMGPDLKNVVEFAVKELRAHRPYSVETPMQYIFIYRVVRKFAEKYHGKEPLFKQEYEQWLKDRRTRMSEQDYRSLSPERDPDLLRGIRRGERPIAAEEAHSRVGELPEKFVSSQSQELAFPTAYPGGRRYDL
ncbi:hypothetical protein L596_027008 [Steinernema carpocapsae]|uniref:Tyrosine-protein phosphatase domain-containing protein n=1 Tax=Steinernema carpocapsae TaxID=34508 RepID=A0A4U5M317_STECR|nr:hypothetical protein L596_027008 [Steinernema carpocapsae]